MLRALWLNLKSMRAAYGASTISMQLVRLIEPELATRSIAGKLRQALHAARLERAASKHVILEQYLNRAYYGNGAFGLASAAQLYFGTGAGELSAGQAAFLAALPRAPRGYDPYTHRPRAERRMRHILSRMLGLAWISEESYQLALDVRLRVRSERTAARAALPRLSARHAAGRSCAQFFQRPVGTAAGAWRPRSTSPCRRSSR